MCFYLLGPSGLRVSEVSLGTETFDTDRWCGRRLVNVYLDGAAPIAVPFGEWMTTSDCTGPAIFLPAPIGT
jgi:hypothetical protein